MTETMPRMNEIHTALILMMSTNRFKNRKVSRMLTLPSTKNRLLPSIVLSCLLTGCTSTKLPEKVDKGSSYACLQPKLDNQAETDKGSLCYFRLFDPANGAVLGNTPYQLNVYAPGGKNLETPVSMLSGVTDQEGYSGIVSAPFSITPQRLRFVQTVGKGELSGGGFHIVRAQDGKPRPGQPYNIETDCGIRYRGVLDEQGYSVIIKSDKACDVRISVGDNRRSQEQ